MRVKSRSRGKASGYSVWIVPTGGAGRRISRAIGSLAKKYCGPSFGPHLTLIGEAGLDRREALRRVSALAKKIKPFSVTLGKAGCERRYFRSLFVRAFGTTELMVANRKAAEIFGMKRAKYYPHVSLFYGGLPCSKRIAIANGISGNFEGLKFEVKRIRLMRTEGAPGKWRKIKDFRLG